MQTEQIDVSCILPIYNCTKYLSDCIKSLTNQSWKNIEIICVNDASTDDSLEVLRKIKQTDDRIKIVNLNINQGAAHARNIGYTYARGEYVLFLDSDDMFKHDMIECAYHACKLNNVDVGLYSYEIIQADATFDDIVIHFKDAQKSNSKNRVITDPRSCNDICQIVECTPWTKLVKKSLIDKYNIKFQDIPNCNDVFFSFATVLSANGVVIIHRSFVYYRTNRAGSLSLGRNNNKTYLPYAIDAVYDFLYFHGIFEKVERSFVNRVLVELHRTFVDVSQEVKIDLSCMLRDIFWEKWKIDIYDLNFFFSPVSYYFYKSIYLGNDIPVYVKEIFAYGSEHLKSLILQLKSMNKKIALWGAGKYGTYFMEIIQSLNLDIEYVIDSNINKHNGLYYGHRINCYDDIKDRIDVIFITNSRWFSSITEIVQDQIEVIDILKELEMKNLSIKNSEDILL